MRHLLSTSGFTVALAFLALSLGGCDTGLSGTDSPDPGEGFDLSTCTIPTDRLADGGVGRGGIPDLVNPAFTTPDQASYLSDTSRVIGVTIDGRALAIPHNILWWHEVVNLNVGGRPIAVTYCPLTGSSLAFDRTVVDGAELGVSGLLFNNNLVMFDRSSSESLWPQMNRAAACGPATGTDLNEIPVVEMRWSAWAALHPDTEVLSNDTGFNRNYTASGYPYGDYERVSNDRLLFDIPIDDRRPPKERILGIPDGEGGLALPFGAFEDLDAAVHVQRVTVDGSERVVFWDRDARGAMAYRPTLGGQSLTFSVEDGAIVDDQTGSRWTLDGRAVDGPQSGSALEPVDRAYVAFWFAWAAFQPDTRIADVQ